MTDQANVPLVIVNPARDFTLVIYDDTAELACPLCAAGRVTDVQALQQIPVAPLPNGGARAVLPPAGAPPVTVQNSDGCLPIREPATLGQLVDLALLHLAEAHPEYLLPAPTTLRSCTGCGCTDADCSQCIARTGHPCSWVTPTRCSACL